MGSISRLSQSSSSSNNYLIYAPFCTKCPNDSICTFIECYDPSQNSWSRVTAIPCVRDNFVLRDFSMVCIGHFIYIIGGRLFQKRVARDNNVTEEINQSVLSSVHRYNVRTDDWEMCAPMITPRFSFACTVGDDKIYVAGGQSTLGQPNGISLTEVYDPALDEWKSLANMSTTRYKCVAVFWHGKVHVIGGFVGDGGNLGPFIVTRSSAEVYDVDRNRWDMKSRMWELDVPPNQIVAMNGKLFSSGDIFMPWKGQIETYDENEKLWDIVTGSHFKFEAPTFACDDSSSNCLPMQRLYLTMAAIGNKFFFLVGYKMPGSRLRSEVHSFDTATNGGGWHTYEPIEEEVEKRLCGHVVSVNMDVN